MKGAVVKPRGKNFAVFISSDSEVVALAKTKERAEVAADAINRCLVDAYEEGYGDGRDGESSAYEDAYEDGFMAGKEEGLGEQE
jgi:hypothetical protein